MSAPAAAPGGCCASSNPYAKGGPLGSLVDSLISGNSWMAREAALKLYTKIVNNILQAPLEPKFRKLSLAKLIPKFGLDFKGIAELLRQVGFVAEGENLLLPESTLTDALCQSLCAWTEREQKSAAGRLEAERVRQENMKDMDKLKAKKDASRAQVKLLGQQAREEVNAKPVNSSVGHAIKFGSTLVKAAPPPPPAKSG